MKNNHLSDKIIVVPGKIEDISLPEAVDVIISEPMGYMLFNERMLESYLHSKKWLKANGELANSWFRREADFAIRGWHPLCPIFNVGQKGGEGISVTPVFFFFSS